MLIKSDYIKRIPRIICPSLLCLLCSCVNKPGSKVLFQKMAAKQTNLHFANKLSYDQNFNIYTYRNFYNCGGVAVGDVNNDRLPDLFFTANMESNKLYL